MSAGETSGLVFSDRGTPPALEIRVNFGVFAGRSVTQAELDRLAQLLLDLVPEVGIISEDRHQRARASEASVHQVRIEVAEEQAPADAAARQELEERLIERADHWARLCLADRSVTP